MRVARLPIRCAAVLHGGDVRSVACDRWSYLLVDFVPGSSLFDLMRLNRELEGLLRHPVDVVSRGGLRARDQAILDEAIEL
jgi:hypothetical protein